MDKFKVVIVEDVKLELKGTEEIFRNDIPEAQVMGAAMTEKEVWPLLQEHNPDLLLLDLGLRLNNRGRGYLCQRARQVSAYAHIDIYGRGA